ncbi:hypothetical protein H0H92_004854 [Tricholoma furcatifolium]|nr:hypothetical protein H0H92_004854 [Tricholoma furcatifolium]
MWPFLPAPDDGSGTVTILEAYRALISANFRPERAVEFHWYSAEEGGLLGSQAVAQDYERRSVNVLAMSQCRKNAKALDPESAFENSNKNIHSINDRIDISDEFSFTHMLEFSKLAVAFAVELGQWSKDD